MLDAGQTRRQIAANIGRTVSAVRNRCEALHLCRTSLFMVAADVNRRLGFSDTAKPLYTWIKLGYLPTVPRDPSRHAKARAVWFIRREDLHDFLVDPRYFHLYDPAKIVEPRWREWTEQARADPDADRWLSTKEVAAHLSVNVGTVIHWVEGGVLPAERICGHYMVSEHLLRSWRMPSQGKRVVRRRRVLFTPDEDRKLAWVGLARERADTPWSVATLAMGERRAEAVYRTRYVRLMAERLDLIAATRARLDREGCSNCAGLGVRRNKYGNVKTCRVCGGSGLKGVPRELVGRATDRPEDCRRVERRAPGQPVAAAPDASDRARRQPQPQHLPAAD